MKTNGNVSNTSLASLLEKYANITAGMAEKKAYFQPYLQKYMERLARKMRLGLSSSLRKR